MLCWRLTVKSYVVVANECIFYSGLQYSELETVFEQYFAVIQWSDILQHWYKKQNKNLFSVNMESL